MMKSAFQIFGIAVLALSPLTLAGGDAVQLLERTDAFEVAYGMSFHIDACGDATTGQLYRQALVEKFENCPFSAEARRNVSSLEQPPLRPSQTRRWTGTFPRTANCRIDWME
jgi:hypothetical protein